MHLSTLLVHEYDPVIEFFVNAVGFELVEDAPAMDSEGHPKRWVVLRPPGGQAGLRIAKAEGDDAQMVGRQLAGRVAFFLRVDDFDSEYDRMTAAGVEFVRAPRDCPHGRNVTFRDILGNLWDMIGPAPRSGVPQAGDGATPPRE
jgi:predicted enzyme related to lactoylglutathione lyase